MYLISATNISFIVVGGRLLFYLRMLYKMRLWLIMINQILFTVSYGKELGLLKDNKPEKNPRAPALPHQPETHPSRNGHRVVLHPQLCHGLLRHPDLNI